MEKKVRITEDRMIRIQVPDCCFSDRHNTYFIEDLVEACNKVLRDNDYNLTFNKYKEIERGRVEYEQPQVVLDRIEKLENEIRAGLKELKERLKG